MSVAAERELFARALEYYRAPQGPRFGVDVTRQVPAGLSELLSSLGKSRGESDELAVMAASLDTDTMELRKAAYFFLRQLFFSADCDHYRLLGLPRNASTDEIRNRYRQLIRLFHPDRNPDGDDWDRLYAPRLNNAYDTLKSAARRREYDASLAPQRSGEARNRVKQPPSRPSRRRQPPRVDVPVSEVLYRSRLLQRHPKIMIWGIALLLLTILLIYAATSSRQPMLAEGDNATVGDYDYPDFGQAATDLKGAGRQDSRDWVGGLDPARLMLPLVDETGANTQAAPEAPSAPLAEEQNSKLESVTPEPALAESAADKPVVVTDADAAAHSSTNQQIRTSGQEPANAQLVEAAEERVAGMQPASAEEKPVTATVQVKEQPVPAVQTQSAPAAARVTATAPEPERVTATRPVQTKPVQGKDHGGTTRVVAQSAPRVTIESSEPSPASETTNRVSRAPAATMVTENAAKQTSLAPQPRSAEPHAVAAPQPESMTGFDGTPVLSSALLTPSSVGPGHKLRLPAGVHPEMLLMDYVRYFESGSLEHLMGLFTEEAIGNEGAGKRMLAQRYGELFRRTSERKMDITELNLKPSYGRDVILMSRVKVAVKNSGESGWHDYAGEMLMAVTRKGRKQYIKRLKHNVVETSR